MHCEYYFSVNILICNVLSFKKSEINSFKAIETIYLNILSRDNTSPLKAHFHPGMSYMHIMAN